MSALAFGCSADKETVRYSLRVGRRTCSAFDSQVPKNGQVQESYSPTELSSCLSGRSCVYERLAEACWIGRMLWLVPSLFDLKINTTQPPRNAAHYPLQDAVESAEYLGNANLW